MNQSQSTTREEMVLTKLAALSQEDMHRASQAILQRVSQNVAQFGAAMMTLLRKVKKKSWCPSQADIDADLTLLMASTKEGTLLQAAAIARKHTTAEEVARELERDAVQLAALRRLAVLSAGMKVVEEPTEEKQQEPPAGIE